MIRPGSPTAARLRDSAGEWGWSATLRAELLAALAAADRLPPSARRRLHALVGHVGQRLDVGGIGVHAISPDIKSALFELAESGPQAVILPLRSGPNSHDVPLEDLAAWFPREGIVLTRLGSPVLGWAHNDPIAPDGPVRVYADPGAWARSNGIGVVILDWSKAWSELGHLSALTADSVTLGQRLEKALLPPKSHRPRLFVRQEALAA